MGNHQKELNLDSKLRVFFSLPNLHMADKSVYFTGVFDSSEYNQNIFAQIYLDIFISISGMYTSLARISVEVRHLIIQ